METIYEAAKQQIIGKYLARGEQADAVLIAFAQGAASQYMLINYGWKK